MMIIFILVQPTPESSDTQEAYMSDEEVVDTMGDNMIEVME